jgi:hypothetical protein
MPSNELYLTVLPLVRMPRNRISGPGIVHLPGSVEQFITLFPDRNFATEFFPDEVQLYVDAFRSNITYLTGGHVTGYEFTLENTNDGRVVVRVVQHVG